MQAHKTEYTKPYDSAGPTYVDMSHPVIPDEMWDAAPPYPEADFDPRIGTDHGIVNHGWIPTSYFREFKTTRETQQAWFHRIEGWQWRYLYQSNVSDVTSGI